MAFLVLAAVFLGVFLLIGYLISGPRYAGPVTDHFDGKKFLNPGNIKAKGGREALRWMLGRKLGPWRERPNLPYGPKPPDRVQEGIRVTFVNHSTFLIQFDGLNLLTDPIWSQRTSPVEWAGPKRMRPPGVRLEDLPKIDIVLLSHNHWDHLDIVTVRKLVSLHRPRIITTLGVGSFLQTKGILAAQELDWWDEAQMSNSLSIQAVPAQHFSGRGIFDRDGSLWCGFVIKRPEGNIYFAGDSGYNTITFKEIGEKCSPIALALIPIGAYKPTWFMSPIHCTPEEAVRIHQEIHSGKSIATHFGTFPLADDGELEPLEELQLALKAAGLDPSAFVVPQEGIPIIL